MCRDHGGISTLHKDGIAYSTNAAKADVMHNSHLWSGKNATSGPVISSLKLLALSFIFNYGVHQPVQCMSSR